MKLRVCQSPGFDPHYNLALEETLLSHTEDTVILYLWQNENTVVIGKNQNPWRECKTALLKQEGGHLARRLSGGGAVFHDLGNLNFTFLMPQSAYDLDRQLAVIENAVEAFGISATRSGRNDILVGERKFSGNAFYKNGKQAYHHGTLLINADLEKLGRYLSPSKLKLQAKGVDSVRSRVGNLGELCPEITVDALKAALVDAFAQIYKGPVEQIEAQPAPELVRRYESWDWNFGQRLPFSFGWEGRTEFGLVQIEADVQQGVIRSLRVYTDSMDWRLAGRLEQAMEGKKLDRDSLIQAAPEFARFFEMMDI